MKKLLFGALLILGTNAFACQMPEEISCKAYFDNLKSCEQLDQSLAQERRDIFNNAIDEQRHLNSNERLRNSQIHKERMQVADIIRDTSMDMLRFTNANPRLIIDNPHCNRL